MAKDEFKNLGFADPKEQQAALAGVSTDKQPEKGVKGELHW